MALSSEKPASRREATSEAAPSTAAASVRRRGEMAASGGERVPRFPVQPPALPFQKRAIQKSQKLLSEGADTVLVSPTGSGKRVMAGHIIQHATGNVIAVCHTNPLREQLEERLCPTYTIQGLLRENRPKQKPDLIVWDECHHCEGEEWRTLRQLYPKALMLGLTATPQRSDGKALTIFQEMVIAAHYSELIAEGVIVPCKVTGPQGVYTDKRPDPVKAYLKAGENEKAIFFLPDIETADDVEKQLRRHKIAAASYHSGLTKALRKATFEGFEQGSIRALVTVDAVTEGIDVPDAQCAVLLQQCHTETPYLQSVGRILRSSSGKKWAHLIDLVGASLRHGPPTSDREYSLHGAGMRMKGSRDTDVNRAPPEQSSWASYDANLVTWYDWKWPTVEDKRRQLGFLRRQAAEHGYTDEQAVSVFKALFPEQQESR